MRPNAVILATPPVLWGQLVVHGGGNGGGDTPLADANSTDFTWPENSMYVGQVI